MSTTPPRLSPFRFPHDLKTYPPFRSERNPPQTIPIQLVHDFKISPRSHIENPPALRTSRLLVGKRSASNTYGTARTEQRDFLQRIRGPPAVDHIGVTLHSELILKVWRRHRCSLVSKRNFARKYAFDSIFEALQDLHPLHSCDLKIFAKESV